MVCSMTNPKEAIIPIHCEQSDAYLSLPVSKELKSRVVVQSCSFGGPDKICGCW